MKCDNCGADNASMISAGYVTPIPDAAPTHYEWEEIWLCAECLEQEMKLCESLSYRITRGSFDA